MQPLLTRKPRHAWHHWRVSRGRVHRGLWWWLLEPWGSKPWLVWGSVVWPSLVPGTVPSHMAPLVTVVAGPGIWSPLITTLVTTSVPRTVLGHVARLSAVKTLPGVPSLGSDAAPATPLSVVGFLVVGFGRVRTRTPHRARAAAPLLSRSQLIETNTVRLLAQGVSSSPARDSKRKT